MTLKKSLSIRCGSIQKGDRRQSRYEASSRLVVQLVPLAASPCNSGGGMGVQTGTPHVALGGAVDSQRSPHHAIGERQGNLRSAAFTEGDHVAPNRRLSFYETIAFARQIAKVAVALVIRESVTEGFDRTVGTLPACCSLEINYVTPESRYLRGPAPYGIHIWDPVREVFSAWWEPFVLVSFRRGGWIRELVANAPSLREDV